jgi:hypothetical protein
MASTPGPVVADDEPRILNPARRARISARMLAGVIAQVFKCSGTQATHRKSLRYD